MPEYWTPMPLYRGETMFLLGGGPSLASADLSMLRGRPVIAINSSAGMATRFGLDQGILFFMDDGWWLRHQAVALEWRGLVISCSRAAKRSATDKVLLIHKSERREDFPPRGSPVVRWGRSSGHIAISLAIALGAARIVLLGYDMRVVGQVSHHHGDYRCAGRPEVYEDFRRHFRGWNAAAVAMGAEVLNATPGSALDEFRRVSLGEALAMELPRAA